MAILDTAKKPKESVRRVKIIGTLQEIEFTFYAPEAKKAAIAGKFNDWNTDSMPMKKYRDGTWRIKVKLAPGRYEYKYLADGIWVQDIPCAELSPNPFGTYNCVIGVD